jgi:hypothetical protein
MHFRETTQRACTFLRGSKYFVTFINKFSRKTWIFFLQAKSGAFAKFKIFKQMVENAEKKKIQVLRNDPGREFLSNKLKTFCENHGIKKQLTITHTPY